MTKSNTIYSFFHFSNLLFQDKKRSWNSKKHFGKLIKSLIKNSNKIRLANFYHDLYSSLTPFYSTFMQYKVDEALQIAYHTKGSYQEKARAAFDYLDE